MVAHQFVLDFFHRLCASQGKVVEVQMEVADGEKLVLAGHVEVRRLRPRDRGVDRLQVEGLDVPIRGDGAGNAELVLFIFYE